jgi:hypothetical protein
LYFGVAFFRQGQAIALRPEDVHDQTLNNFDQGRDIGWQISVKVSV